MAREITYTVTFSASQSLTDAQVAHLKSKIGDLVQNLPSVDKENSLDIPEWVSFPEWEVGSRNL